MTAKLLMLHGWGFDATLWDGLRSALPDHEAVAWDRGYFGAPAAPAVAGPVLAIGHSLGALRLALEPPPGCIGLIAINGFDRFAGEGAVAPRVVQTMLRRLQMTPKRVLDEFLARCGSDPAPDKVNFAHLATDLALLAEADARGPLPFPVLVLHGAADPILPEAMRAHVFAGAPRVSHPDHGHLLPLTAPGWCAERIRAFAA